MIIQVCIDYRFCLMQIQNDDQNKSSSWCHLSRGCSKDVRDNDDQVCCACLKTQTMYSVM